MKKVVIFGGGTGLSHVLKGLKLFPVDITAIISVSDNGSSTGVLKKEMNIPAVGDIGTILVNMANTSEDITKMLKYRFGKKTSLDNHPIKNLLLAALYDIKGNLTDATDILCKMLNINGTILPITEDKVEIIGYFDDGKRVVGEEQITEYKGKIIDLKYNKKVKVNEKVYEALYNADLIIFSPGSLYTSILPHLIIPEVRKAIENSKAKKMYVCNLFTQPGETDSFNVSDHLNILNKYIKIDTVICNNAEIPKSFVKKYSDFENKDVVKLDRENIKDTKIIESNIFTLEDNIIRHDALKTGYLIFSYLMDNN